MNPDEIVKSYYKKIYKLSLYYLNNESDAGDLTHDIFFKVIKSLDSFGGKSDIYTWIYRIALNTLRNHLRRKKIVNFISFADEMHEIKDEVLLTSKNPAIADEEKQERTIKLLKLENAIKKLSDRERTAFFFFHYEKIKQKEIAKIMGTSVSAVESLIFKSMKKIKKNVA